MENCVTSIYKGKNYLYNLRKQKKKENLELIYQRFIPEGWEESRNPVSKEVLEQAMQMGSIMQGVVTKCDADYNLHIDFGNHITGVIPREEVEAVKIGEEGIPNPNICMSKVNQYVQFKVKEIKEDDCYILSRKEVGNEALKWVNGELQEGQMVSGIVRSIRQYGAFVEIGGGIVGLLHIEDISVARIKSPFERLKIGQKANFVVKLIDRGTNRILLSYKELLGSWEENVKKFEEGATVVGIARETEKSNNGIFVELTPNLVGLAEYKEGIHYGQDVNVYIKRIIPEKKKVKLIIV